MINEQAPKRHAAAADAIAVLARLALFALAAALPWELFQSVPGVDLTLVKVFGPLLAAAALARLILERDWRLLRSGIEAPAALFALAGGITLAYSQDPSATLFHLRVYASHALLFYSVVVFVRRPEEARMLLTVFCASVCVLAALQLACNAGWAFPTATREVRMKEFRVTPDDRHGIALRMAAASADLNAGALPLLAAFALGVFLFPGTVRRMRQEGTVQRWERRAAGAGVLVLTLLVLAGIAITMSRSALAAAILLLAAYAIVLFRRRGRAAWPALAAGAAALLILAFSARDYAAALFVRAAGLVGDDASYEGRMAALQAAFRMLPRHGWLGVGLGASPAAIAQSPMADQAGGVHVHSMLVKALLETGVLGLVAYLWLWFAIAMRLVRGLAHPAPAARQLAKGGLGVAAAFFVMTAVQPFGILSLFPFLAALLLAPLAPGRQSETAAASAIVPREPLSFGAAVAACASVALLVGWSFQTYQETAEDVAAYADALEQGARAEEAADWAAAQEGYFHALSIADYAQATVLSRRLPETTAGVSGDDPLVQRRLYEHAANVFQVEYVSATMQLPTNDERPACLALFGLGRTWLKEGNIAAGLDALSMAAEAPGAPAQTHMLLGEGLWRLGRFSEALRAHAAARKAAEEGHAAEQAWLADLEQQVSALMEHHPIQAAHVLRRLGRWDEASDAARGWANEPEPAAEALFLLGVEAELRAEPEAALALYLRALKAAPSHAMARARAEALSDPAESGVMPDVPTD